MLFGHMLDVFMGTSLGNGAYAIFTISAYIGFPIIWKHSIKGRQISQIILLQLFAHDVAQNKPKAERAKGIRTKGISRGKKNYTR